MRPQRLHRAGQGQPLCLWMSPECEGQPASVTTPCIGECQHVNRKTWVFRPLWLTCCLGYILSFRRVLRSVDKWQSGGKAPFLFGPRRSPMYSPLMTTREKLLAEIETFLASTGVSPTSLGLRVGDPALIGRLRRGVRCNIKISTVDNLHSAMREYRENGWGSPPPKKRGGRFLEAHAA